MLDLVNDMEVREQTGGVERDQQFKIRVCFDPLLYSGAHAPI